MSRSAFALARAVVGRNALTCSKVGTGPVRFQIYPPERTLVVFSGRGIPRRSTFFFEIRRR